MAPSAPAFATPAGLVSSSSLARGVKRPNICRCRASAQSPPPPPNSVPQGGDADEARASLERMLALDMTKMAPESDGGKCACIWCNGSGKRRCAWCQGKGTRLENVTPSWEQLAADAEGYKEGEPMRLPEQIPTVCSACSGSCELRCAYCRGSGIGSYGMGYKQ